MESEIDRLKAENDHLRKLLGMVDSHAKVVPLLDADGTKSALRSCDSDHPAARRMHTWEAGSHDLSKEQVSRYSRQLILPAFGPAGKLPPITAHSLREH